MAGIIRASGQGITRSFTYTGQYGDTPDFGAVTLEDALHLIQSLPFFSVEAFEDGLCPPAILLTDEAGSTLTVYREAGGAGFGIHLGGPAAGSVLSGASFEDVSRVVADFFSGIYPEAADRAEVAGGVSGVGGRDLLAYMPLYTYSDPFSIREREEVGFHVWREEGGSTYIELNEEGGGVIRIPLNHVIEVVFRRGGLLRGASVKVVFYRGDGGTGKVVKRIDGKNRDWIPRVASKLSRVMPGRVRIE